MPTRKKGRRACGRSRSKTTRQRGFVQRGFTQRGFAQRGFAQKGRTCVPRGRTYIPLKSRKILKTMGLEETQQILTNISKKANCRDITDMFDNGEKVLAEFKKAMRGCRRNYSPKECLKLQKTLLPLVTLIFLSIDRLKKGVPARVW
jgi:hypothetical protein